MRLNFELTFQPLSTGPPFQLPKPVRGNLSQLPLSVQLCTFQKSTATFLPLISVSLVNSDGQLLLLEKKNSNKKSGFEKEASWAPVGLFLSFKERSPGPHWRHPEDWEEKAPEESTPPVQRHKKAPAGGQMDRESNFVLSKFNKIDFFFVPFLFLRFSPYFPPSLIQPPLIQPPQFPLPMLFLTPKLQ